MLKKLFKYSERDTSVRYYIFNIFGFALFLHYLHSSEEKDIYHNHPWNGISFIFGRYKEQIIGQDLKIRRGFRWVSAKKHHRIEVSFGPVWTLFFHFRRNNRWSVINKHGKILVWEPWRYIGGTTSYKPKD